ncbi:MAG: hypothetical protein L3K03_00875 [Thermoplasmata archaeon]|nr:hypothetical protein [Thermoplasmata archaeon]
MGRASSGQAGRWLGAGFILFVLLISALSGNGSRVVATPTLNVAAPTGAGTHALSAVHPAASTDNNEYCSKINATICVAVYNGSPDIVPNPGNLVSSVMPNATDSVNLWIKSRFPLTWINAALSGVYAPIRINVSGVLWNGNLWMNPYDGTVWHADGGSGGASSQPYYTPAPLNTVNNKTYPYWYSVTIANHSENGGPNFFAGEFVTWWIYILSNNSCSTPSCYTHTQSPTFHYRIAGAWAYSPYAGAGEYGGADAWDQDLYEHQTPLAPNWNDSVIVSIMTTEADILNRTTIGAAWLTVGAITPAGFVLPNLTLTFPVTLQGGSVGAVQTTVTIPNAYSAVPGTIVSYSITAYDSAKGETDQIVTSAFTFTVGGNGTFLSGLFEDDLSLVATPSTAIVDWNATPRGGAPPPSIPEGTNVSLVLSSLDTSTAILTSEVQYSFSFPGLTGASSGTVLLSRINSTTEQGQIPALPLGAWVNFTVYAWDYVNNLEISKTYTYSTTTFANAVTTVAPNLAFFNVYVYDNGTHEWVTGAQVTVSGSNGFIDSVSTTTYGVTYPNTTGHPYVPLLLPANVTYNITVRDPSFQPVGAVAGNPVSVFFLAAPESGIAKNPSGTEAPIAVASTYTVIESGLGIYFWLNATPPGPAYSHPAQLDGSLAIAPLATLLVTCLAGLGFLLWWRQIRAKRREQEKRITL